MSFKLVVFIALLAVANAGVVGPAYATYGAPSVAVASPTITSQASNTFRSFGNLGQVSTYQKTIDTPYSSVRKYDTRVSNDALAYPAIAKTAIATPAVGAYHGYAAPAVAAYPGYAAPAFAKTAIAAPAVAAYHGYAAPAFAKTAIAAPAVAAYPGYAAPAFAKTAIAAPAVAAYPGYAAPAFAKTAIAAPAVAAYPGYAAPAFAKTAIAAPAVAGYHGYAAPAVKTAVATPHGGLLGVAYSAAPTVAHMTFQGYGVNYAY